MCVIMVVTDKRPSKLMIDKAWTANSEGAGIAWRQGGRVHWRKGMMKQTEVEAACLKTPMPYIVHFRKASAGGTSPELTHPFPISEDVLLDLEGSTPGAVLFHNGTWGDWHTKCLEAAMTTGTPIPSGAWSDTRGIAWLCSIFGEGLTGFMPTQKGAILSPKTMQFMSGSTGWPKVEGIWCSNDTFMQPPSKWVGTGTYRSTMCRYKTCTETSLLDYKGYCPKHRENQDVYPSLVNPGNRLPEAYMSMDRVIELHNLGKVSKSLLKKYRRAYGELSFGGTRAQQGIAQLRSHTADILQRTLDYSD